MASRMWQEHPDRDVQAALRKLCDALVSWERATSRQSILIIREREGGFDPAPCLFAFRADSGRPLDSDQDDIPDSMLLGRFNA